MSRTTDYPAVDSAGRITRVSGECERGVEIAEKINMSALRYMERHGRNAKYIVLDSQSYLDLHAHMELYRQYPRDYESPLLSNSSIERINTPVGSLTPIVLPQVKRRIQVTGDPLFTAIETVSRHQND